MNNRDNVYGIMLLILVELLLISACLRTGTFAPTVSRTAWNGQQGHVSGNSAGK